MRRVGVGVGKTDAIAELAARAGLSGIDPHAWDIDPVLDRLIEAFAPDASGGLRFADAADLPGVTEQTCFPAAARKMAWPDLRNGRHDSFPENFGSETSPAFRVLTIQGGVFLHLSRAPVALAGDRRTVVRDVSSRYARLAPFYDIALEPLLDRAPTIPGAVLVLSDDIFPLNFCHWLVDTLPRLAFLGARRDVTVVVSDQDVAFKRDSLALCGFTGDRVVHLPDFQAVAAETLLVPFDTRIMPHPAHKAAPWALDFLRARIGFSALATARPGPRKLYVSRADAGGRRVLNDDAMMRLLAPLGYQMATLSGLTLVEQVALFAGASHVVGLHGAGLSNIVFSPPGARLLEILPATYGMPTFYVLAAGQGLGYATYIARDVRPGSRTQVDDVVIDVADFLACCGDLL